MWKSHNNFWDCFLLSSCWFWESNSDYNCWWPGPLPIEPSHLPYEPFYITTTITSSSFHIYWIFIIISGCLRYSSLVSTCVEWGRPRITVKCQQRINKVTAIVRDIMDTVSFDLHKDIKIEQLSIIHNPTEPIRKLRT